MHTILDQDDYSFGALESLIFFFLTPIFTLSAFRSALVSYRNLIFLFFGLVVFGFSLAHTFFSFFSPFASKSSSLS